MIALPSQPALPVPNAPSGDTTAVLPAALLLQPATTTTPPLAASPSFDQTLQDLLQGLARAPGAPTAPAAALAPQGSDTDTPDAALDQGDSATTLAGFDPALTSLQTAAAPVAWQQAQAVLAQTIERATQDQAAPRQGDAVVATALTQPSRPPAQALPMALASGLPAVQTAPNAAAQDTAPAALPVASTAAPKPVAPLLPAAADSGSAPADRAHATLSAIALNAPNAASEAAPGARSADGVAPARAPTLLDALAERIGLHTERGSERVLIRLDPPHRGQIEIQIRHDASGATQVTLTASHGDVVRQLHAIGDSLRQELAQRQGGDVTVQIAQQSREDDGRQRQGQQQASQQQPGLALNDGTDAAEAEQFALATDRT